MSFLRFGAKEIRAVVARCRRRVLDPAPLHLIIVRLGDGELVALRVDPHQDLERFARSWPDADGACWIPRRYI